MTALFQVLLLYYYTITVVLLYGFQTFRTQTFSYPRVSYLKRL